MCKSQLVNSKVKIDFRHLKNMQCNRECTALCEGYEPPLISLYFDREIDAVIYCAKTHGKKHIRPEKKLFDYLHVIVIEGVTPLERQKVGNKHPEYV